MTERLHLGFHKIDAVLHRFQASHVSTGTTNNALALNPSGGNVGIGTTAPTASLHLSTGLTTNLGGALTTSYTTLGITAASVAASSDWKVGGIMGGSGPYSYTTNVASGAYFTITSGITSFGPYQISITVSSTTSGASFNVSNVNGTIIGPYALTSTPTVYTGILNVTSFVYPIYIYIVGPSGTVFTFSNITVGRLDTSSAGFVGIGTTAPGPKFHVAGGNIGVNSGNGIGFRMDIPGYNNNIGASAIYAGGATDALRFVGESDSSSQRLFSFGYHSGNDPAQTWNPKLYINSYTGSLIPVVDNTSVCGFSGQRWASVWAANGTIQTSDSKEKDSAPLSYGMNEILQMRTIKYKWKSQADLPDDDPAKNFEYYGFCADELAPLFPELVYNEDTTAPIQMNYSEILPVVVNALKEEHASAVALKATVDSQAEQIVSLQTQLGSLLAWAQTQGYSASL